MKVALHGRVTEADLELADLCGIENIEAFITGPNTVPPFSMRETLCIPHEKMIGDDYVAARQNDFRVLLHADALIVQGRDWQAEHLVSIAQGYGIPVMELP